MSLRSRLRAAVRSAAAGSLSGRLTAMVVVFGASVFVAGGLCLHGILHGALERQIHDELTLRMSVYSTLVSRDFTEAQWREYLVPKLDGLVPVVNNTRIWVVSEDPRFRYGSPGADIVGLARSDGFGTLHVDGANVKDVTLVSSVPARGERPAVRLVVARNPDAFWQTLSHFETALTQTILVSVLVVAVLGHWIARVGLRPLERLSRQAQALNPLERAQRLGFSPLPSELSKLTDSFNGALERLERSYKQLESFNADVAHELRTPLMNLIGGTQVVLSRRRPVQELEEVMHSNLEEFDRLRGIVNDMLFLARADQGALARDSVEVSLAQEVAKVVEFLEPVVEDAGVNVKIVGDARVCIETALFKRAVSNLLHNAIQHSNSGAEVTIAIEGAGGASPSVAVSNPGIRIDDQHLEHLFDRFYRVGGARPNSVENHGLGLAIVKAIATMHRGRVFARSEEGRNTFGFSLSPQR